MKKLLNLITCFIFLSIIGAPLTQTKAADIQATSASLGTWNCWDDGSVDPCHNGLSSISLTSLTNGWAAGANGTMLRWNGSSWTKAPNVTSNNLEVIRMNSVDDGWAAGSGGIILHWNGSSWSQVSSPTTSTIRDISIVSTNNVWAAGYKIYHWDGVAWTYIDPPLTSLSGISMTPGTNGMDGWAVGSSGKILRWNGTAWSVFTSPTVEYLYDVEMISATDGWIVGNKGIFLHWNGSVWSPAATMASDISTIFEIEAASTNDAWAIGFDNGAFVIYHWTGAIWGLSEANTDSISYSGLAVTPGTDGEDAWVVAGGGYILRWDGAEWTPFNAPYVKTLYDVQMLLTNDGWAVGTGFPITSGNALHWDGSEWVSRDIINAYDLDFYTDSSGTTGWTVGKWGEIKYFNGYDWDPITSPVEVDLYAIDMISHDNAWAVGFGYDFSISGERGVMAKLQGDDWVEIALPASDMFLMDIAMLTSTNGWAVGMDGIILKWNGANWQSFTSPTSANLTAIVMISESNGWIVGGAGTILHWDGVQWSSYGSPVGTGMIDIAMITATDGWAVGDAGGILHWDGVNWAQLPSPTQTSLMGITYASEYELWAVGMGGVILHYDVTPTLTTNYSSGAPDSFFTLTGTNFPANVIADLSINGEKIGEVATDELGGFNFILSTSLADEGIYYVTASVNPSDTVRITLDEDEEVRIKDGSYTVFVVPDGIAIQATVLPIIVK